MKLLIKFFFYQLVIPCIIKWNQAMIPPTPSNMTPDKWKKAWSNRKDWTYYSRRQPPTTTGAYSLAFFDSISGGVITDNIPAPNQFPNAYKFYLAKIGISIIPLTTGTISTATLYQLINESIMNGRLSLKVINEVYFEKPFSKFFTKISIAPDATVKMCSGEIDLIGEIVLNKSILFSEGTSFAFNMDTSASASLQAAISKIECRMEGFLIEAQ